MSCKLAARFNRRRQWLTLCLAGTVAVCGWMACSLEAQLNQQSITGGPATSNRLPPVAGRPDPSALEFRNLTQRPEDDRQSIAGLIEHIQTEDATIEVIVGRGRLITLQEPLAQIEGAETPVVAVGDPTVVDFDVLPSSRMIRVLGRRIGMTDLSVVTASGNAYSFTVHIVYDLNLLRAYLKQMFPNANLHIVQMFEHVVVEGEAASTDQMYAILQTMNAFLTSTQAARSVSSDSSDPFAGARRGQPQPRTEPSGDEEGGGQGSGEGGTREPTPVEGGVEDRPTISATLPPPQIINLIRVPGVQQIMLQVKIAEVNRTALRRMGSSVFYRDGSGRSFGSSQGSSVPFVDDNNNLLGLALGSNNTSFAILPNTSLSLAMDALRSNQVVTILAEPNLMAMHGQQASFLAGGEFPVPVPQTSSAGGTTFTIEFKEFGVLLDFIPYIMDNGAIRLHVAPEVSTIDSTIGVSTGGVSVPGVNTRRANTTVELRQGQTLALAGLLQVDLDAGTSRLPGLGDLPYLGPFFSNNSHQRAEKELVILVTPYFVDPMEQCQVTQVPGYDVRDPDDHEFYWLNRIEGRAPHVNYRATSGWDDPLGVRHLKNPDGNGQYPQGAYGHQQGASGNQQAVYGHQQGSYGHQQGAYGNQQGGYGHQNGNAAPEPAAQPSPPSAWQLRFPRFGAASQKAAPRQQTGQMWGQGARPAAAPAPRTADASNLIGPWGYSR